MATRKKKRKHRASTYGKRLGRGVAKAHKARHKKKRKKKVRSGLTPLSVIEHRAKRLKRNARAAAVYRRVLK